MTTRKTSQKFINRITLDSFKYLNTVDFGRLRKIHQRSNQDILHIVNLSKHRQKYIQAAAERARKLHETSMNIIGTDREVLEIMGPIDFRDPVKAQEMFGIMDLREAHESNIKWAEAQLEKYKQEFDSLQFIEPLLTEYISRRRKFAEKFNSLNAFPSSKVQVYRPLHVVETSLVSVRIH